MDGFENEFETQNLHAQIEVGVAVHEHLSIVASGSAMSNDFVDRTIYLDILPVTLGVRGYLNRSFGIYAGAGTGYLIDGADAVGKHGVESYENNDVTFYGEVGAELPVRGGNAVWLIGARFSSAVDGKRYDIFTATTGIAVRF